jgi:aminoglycoside 3-N-acetyltransferase
MLVRDLDAGVVTHVNPMGELLWRKGLYHGCRPGEGSGLRTIAAADLFDATAEVIRQGRAPGMLYRIENRQGAAHE